MLKDILSLTKLQLCNLFGLNEVLHTRDKGKKTRYWALSIVWALLILMVIAYVCGLVYGLHLLGVGEIAPMYLYTIISLVLMVLTFFKAGGTLFTMKFYDVLISLPVSKHAILISRFLTMYVSNLLLGILVMVPGIILHGYFAKPGFLFYIICLLVLLFLPMLPLTVSSIIGAGIKWISSRMKHRKLVEVLLTLLFVVVVMAGGMSLGTQEENLTPEMLTNLAATVAELLGSLFPPALWFHQALQGNILSLLLVLGIPTLLFSAFIAVLAPHFQEICAGLNASNAKQNYKIGVQNANSVLISLWKREAKLYFSSSLYVTNTIVGYILAVILCVSFMITGVDALAESLGFPDMLPYIIQLLPCLISLPLCMANSSACALSMEGKEFWQLQILPIRARDVYTAKLLWNLTLALPFYLVCDILLILAVKPDVTTLLHYVLLPLVFMLFSIVLGLFFNTIFPVLNWDNEARVIKQSASVGFSMLVGIVSLLIPAVLVVALGIQNTFIYFFAIEAGFLALTAFLYTLTCKKELITYTS